MRCKKCDGFLRDIVLYDESFNLVAAFQCINCGTVIYPNFTPLPIKPDNHVKSRKGIPTMFTYKKGVTSGK